MSLAIFDLDNTLIAGDSDHSWGEFLVSKSIVDETYYKKANDGFYQDYVNGTLDIYAYLEFALAPLSEQPIDKLLNLREEFMESIVSTMILSKANELIQTHKDSGDTLLIITATNDFITAPIANKLGIPNLLATNAEMKNEKYTGKVAGTPCFQDGKVTRLNQWLETYDGTLAGSYFYSDSANDVPLLEKVDNPVAVDPDERLKSIAEKRDWPVISLR